MLDLEKPTYRVERELDRNRKEMMLYVSYNHCNLCVLITLAQYNNFQ